MKHEVLMNLARFESDRGDSPNYNRSKMNSQIDNFVINVDDENDYRLELLRQEIRQQRDLKSQITMFNAHKDTSSREIT